MRSTFGGIEISKRGLFAQQAALQTTGHNIANANTRGFSRQIVNMVATKPLEYPGMQRSTVPGQTGQGVEIDNVMRIRESFLDKQYYNENKGLGEWNVRKDTLEKLESIINEPSDTGMRQVLDNFWNSWQELSKQPDNLETRAVVKESALALTDAFNNVMKKLNDLSADLNDNMNVKVTEVDSTLRQIAALNSEIFRIEGLGNNANDLRDQRDVLLDDLSKVINVTVTEEATGYNVQMGNVVLVQGANATPFTNATVTAAFPTNLNSGELYGLNISQTTYLTDYKNQLNTLAATIVKEVNTTHAQGYTLKAPATLGGNFFNPIDPASPRGAAEQMSVSTTITSDVENIAASKRVDGGKVVKGNNELALQMAGIKNEKFTFGSGILTGGTFDEYLRAVVGQMGVQTQEAIRQSSNQKILVDQVESRRQSVSGVSLDEEMANMIKFQHAYNAAARALTTFDETLDKVVNSMGLVGR
jgi:flagellar hook-associated protein 1